MHDFVIVGAGSAGSILAERLTADGRFSVLLLEAGGSDRSFSIGMPLGYAKSFADPAVNWNYQTEPDPGLAGRATHWPRGKVLGGSSSINALVWIRGHRSDYDDWRNQGNVGWGYDDVLPAFKALEDNSAGADAWRGAGGPVRVTDMTAMMHPLTWRFIAAGLELGYRHNPDFNGAGQEGVGFYQLTVRNGRRESAATAFLHPAMKRRNLEVMTKALATRILFEGRRAVGVEYLLGGTRHVARAAREVIVAGGAINSPQLLQLSGIGPGEHLAGLDIPVVVDNAWVGANLQDHQSVNYAFRANTPTLNRLLRPWWGQALVGARYLLTRTGPLAMSLNQGGGFLRSDPGQRRPNLQIYFQAASSLPPRPGGAKARVIDPWDGFALGISNCRPKSRGHVRLASPEPEAPPRITVNALSRDEDVAEMLAGVKILRRMATTQALSQVLVEEMRPGTRVGDDAAFVADLRNRAGTVFHPSATCRMAPDASQGVVSPRLAVHGVEGLRVVDASVFPDIIAGNTNAPTMMVAWRGARMIMEDNR